MPAARPRRPASPPSAPAGSTRTCRCCWRPSRRGARGSGGGVGRPGGRVERFDLVVVRSTWDYFARREEFLAWAERVAAVTALHNPVSVLRWNSDKRYLRDLERAGVPIVPTTFVEPGEGLRPRCRGRRARRDRQAGRLGRIQRHRPLPRRRARRGAGPRRAVAGRGPRGDGAALPARRRRARRDGAPLLRRPLQPRHPQRRHLRRRSADGRRPLRARGDPAARGVCRRARGRERRSARCRGSAARR